MLDPKTYLDRGARFPYDAPDDWDGRTPLPPADWAHAAARGVVQELGGRSGLDTMLGELDPDIRREIVANLAAIIREAAPK